MNESYLEQLLALGIPPSQLPVYELEDKLNSGELFFMVDIAPDTTFSITPNLFPVPDPNFMATFYFAPDHPGRPVKLTHFVATLYTDSGDIFRCRPFRILGATGVPSVQEAKNLLEGRAVLKRLYANTPAEYDTWLQLNFNELDKEGSFKLREFRANRGRKLDCLLRIYPIVEMDLPKYSSLIITALQHGERVEVQIRQRRKSPISKVLEYDPRLPLLKLLSPVDFAPTVNLSLLKSSLYA